MRSFSVEKIVVRMKNVKFRGKNPNSAGRGKLWALVITIIIVFNIIITIIVTIITVFFEISFPGSEVFTLMSQYNKWVSWKQCKILWSGLTEEITCNWRNCFWLAVENNWLLLLQILLLLVLLLPLLLITITATALLFWFYVVNKCCFHDHSF